MTADVSTLQTKAHEGVMLVPIMLGSDKNDRVFFLLHIEGKHGDADTLKEECVSILTHAVLESEGGAYERLESALKELNGLLKGFLLNSAVRAVHALVAVLERDGTMHVSHVGRAEAYLIRDGTASQVTEYSRGKPPVAFMHIVSGPLNHRDNVIFSTQRLLRSLTPAQLAQTVARGGDVLRTLVSKLESEREAACIAHIAADVPAQAVAASEAKSRSRLPSRGDGRRSRGSGGKLASLTQLRLPTIRTSGARGALRLAFDGLGQAVSDFTDRFMSDLKDPKRKRKAHLLLLAGSAGAIVVVWMVVQLTLSSQKSQTRTELKDLMQQITADISTAENRQLTGDPDSANAILLRAEERARQVMGSESGLFRGEALQLLDQIKSKREEINKVVRIVTPRVMANLAAKKSDILAQGLIGLPSGEFLVFDRQDLYRVSLNSVEPLDRVSGEELLLDGTYFSRFNSRVFMTTGNSVIEVVNNQPVTMKTEDAAGWVTGADIESYLRYLYVLAPERKQIYKYERLSSRYGPPAEYNVNGDITGALDMTITGPVYVLKDMPGTKNEEASVGVQPGEQREILKLLRGEKQPFTIRNLPPGALNNVSRIFKPSPTGNLYFLDPEGKRIVVASNDGDLGESLYLKQFSFDSEQVGTLKDLYVDPDDARLYVLDEKHLFAVDLQGR